MVRGSRISATAWSFVCVLLTKARSVVLIGNLHSLPPAQMGGVEWIIRHYLVKCKALPKIFLWQTLLSIKKRRCMRFQKRIKLFPGVTINLSKSGVTASIGPKGAKINVGGDRPRVTVGLPGTGLSHTEAFGDVKRSPQPLAAVPGAAKRSGWRWVAALLVFFFWMWLLRK
jgi:hypothetical protein